MSKWHKNLTLEHWGQFAPQQQILMIGSELYRAKDLAQWQDKEAALLCCERALELVDLTVKDPRWLGKFKQLLRWRELLAEAYLSLRQLGVSISQPWWPYLYKELLTVRGQVF